MAGTAADVREQAQGKAQEATSKATDKVRTQVDQRSTDVGEKVASTATDIRSVGDHLREQGKNQPAKLADQAARHVERAGTWLRESDSDRILNDVEEFGRRQPWAFALGGLAIGMVSARFLKASSSRRYQQHRPLTSASDGIGSGSGHAPAAPITTPAPASNIARRSG
jgi:uncharacterized membrane-anchored protein YhcB (DUF1043 family)